MTWRLFAVRGWGSAITESMLALCGVAAEIEDVEGFDRPGPARDRLLAANPLAQVPTLVLPDGAVMTESAAITLLLAERFPEAGLAPPPGDPQRAFFLRWLIRIVANVYPTFTFADYPERFAVDRAEPFVEAVASHRRRLWSVFEEELGDGDWVLGESLSALDIFVAVMTHFTPRRDWFAANCPRLARIAENADRHAKLESVLVRNFGGRT